ncbi:MAG: FAD-dependent oxidoreductase, partial [Candidatus Thermoplasmatota archaeon]|nr:FAD-dependent oxidoreductase [Candidatus Thermoplasmatota archaeon]
MGISVNGDPTLDMKGLVSWKDSIVDRLNKGVESLLRSAGAEVIHGWATFTGPKTCSIDSNGQSLQIEAENVILATGSTHIDLPFMPCDEEMILSSTGALDLQELPAEVAIIGGGYIGLELGCALSKLGSKVTVIEGMDDILAMMDKEIRRPLEIWLKKHGVVINRGALARGVEIIEEGGGSKKA